MAPVFIVIVTASIECYVETETFKHQYAVCNLVYNFTLNHAILRLMLTNMTKREFAIVGIENIFGVLPLLVHLCSPTPELAKLLNPLVSYACAIILHLKIYVHLGLLSQQFYAHNPHRNFWYILEEPEEKDKKQK